MPADAASPPSPIDTERIELRLFRYFLAVEDERHFGRAARRLYISQPPLSKAIRKLEAQLGVELLERGNGGITPTEAGTVFAEEARKVLAGVDLAVAEARRAGGAGSPLRIGCAAYVELEPLHRFVAALEERQLVTRADVARLPAVEQIRRLREGQLDLGIFPHSEGQDGLETEPLLPEEPLAAYMATDHPLATKEAVVPDDLREEPVLVFQSANPALWEMCRERFDDAGYEFDLLRDVVGSNDGRDGLLAAASGRGVVLLPASMLEMAQADSIVARRPLDPPVSMPHTVVAWRANPAPQLLRVVTLVREVAQDLYSDRGS
jgi:DNA-binding transcriptional LysR family regulator